MIFVKDQYQYMIIDDIIILKNAMNLSLTYFKKLK